MNTMKIFSANAGARAARTLALAFSALVLAVPQAQAQHHGGGGFHGSHGGFHGHGGRGWGPGPFWGGVGLGIGLGLGGYYYGSPWYPYGPTYVVTDPAPLYYDAPQGATPTQPVPPATATPVPGSSTNPPDPVIYPRNGQSAGKTESDRQECDRWAGAQPKASMDSVYQRGLAACMDARGYTVR